MSPARRRASDPAASARARLSNLSRERGVELQLLLSEFAIERLLFGDAITPAPERERYPTLLGHPQPNILVYPREAVVAEKLEAMVSLGVTNSRMKDFYDVQVLAPSFPFSGPVLAQAIGAMFHRRGAPIPTARPLVLTRDFLGAPARQTQWRAFLRRGRLHATPDAEELADALDAFLGPPLRALAQAEPFGAEWPAGGPWRQQIDMPGKAHRGLT